MHRVATLLAAGVTFILVVGCGRSSPYSGLRWDKVAKPLATPNAMAGVEAFLRTNGWQMQTGGVLFFSVGDKMRPLAGIPWSGLTGKEHLAITCDGILYVP